MPMPQIKRPHTPRSGGPVVLGVAWTHFRILQSLFVVAAVLAVIFVTHPHRRLSGSAGDDVDSRDGLDGARQAMVHHSFQGSSPGSETLGAGGVGRGGARSGRGSSLGEGGGTLRGGDGGAGVGRGGGGVGVGSTGVGKVDDEDDPHGYLSEESEGGVEDFEGGLDGEPPLPSRSGPQNPVPTQAVDGILGIKARIKKHRAAKSARAAAENAVALQSVGSLGAGQAGSALAQGGGGGAGGAKGTLSSMASQAMSSLASFGASAGLFDTTPAPALANDTACRMPWLSMNHKTKIQFFDSHPECAYLNACEGELAMAEDPPGRIEHSSYIYRFTENIRYTHMAMIERLPNNRLVSVWQAAPLPENFNETDQRLAVEGLDQQHIMMSISKDDTGSRWLTPRKLPLQNKASLWSPVPHLDQDGKLWLFYSESRLCKKAEPCHKCKLPPCPPIVEETEICHTNPEAWVPGGDIKVTTSVGPLTDNVWTRARTIFSLEEGGSIPKVISNKVAVLSSGEWLLPMWREQATSSLPANSCPRREEDLRSGCLHGEVTPCMSGTEESAGVLWSGDQGKTWRAFGEIVDPAGRTSLIEGSVAELRNHSVFMVFRTTVGCLYSSVSHDKGRTWAEPQSMAVPNPNSKVHMISLKPGGELVLAFNNHRSANAYRGLKNCKACRSRMHLAISRDNGETWEHSLSMDDELSSSAVRIHYPCITQLGTDPRVVVVYTRFYLGRKLGLISPDQGVVASAVDLSEALNRPMPEKNPL